MALSIRNRKTKDVSILDVSGKITLGENAGMFRDELASLVAQGEIHILVNMGGVSYVDSAGLGEFVGAYTTVRNQGGKLKLLHVQGKMRDLLQITKLHTVFEAFDDEAKAVASF